MSGTQENSYQSAILAGVCPELAGVIGALVRGLRVPTTNWALANADRNDQSAHILSRCWFMDFVEEIPCELAPLAIPQCVTLKARAQLQVQLDESDTPVILDVVCMELDRDGAPHVVVDLVMRSAVAVRLGASLVAIRALDARGERLLEGTEEWRTRLEFSCGEAIAISHAVHAGQRLEALESRGESLSEALTRSRVARAASIARADDLNDRLKAVEAEARRLTARLLLLSSAPVAERNLHDSSPAFHEAASADALWRAWVLEREATTSTRAWHRSARWLAWARSSVERRWWSVFDVNFYIWQLGTQGKAVASTRKVDLIHHYLSSGVSLGLAPNPLFSSQRYLSANPDVSELGIEPLHHYLAFGYKEGRRCSDWLDADVVEMQWSGRGDMSPLEKYLALPAEQRQASRLVMPMDTRGLEDVPSDFSDATIYYILNGWRDGVSGIGPIDWFVRNSVWHLPSRRAHLVDFAVDDFSSLLAALRPKSRGFSAGDRASQGTQGLPPMSIVAPSGEAALSAEQFRSLRSELVSIDVWGTLVVRELTPDQGKWHSARRIRRECATRTPSEPLPSTLELVREREVIESEIAARHPHGEYQIEDVLLQQLIRRGWPYDELKLRKLADEIADEETHAEATYSYLDIEILKWMESLGDSSAIWILSDFYFTQSRMARFLEQLGFEIPSDRVLVSASTLASKRLGLGHSHLREKARIGALNHIHVGDSLTSDVAPQVSSGGTAVWWDSRPDDRLKVALKNRLVLPPSELRHMHGLSQLESVEPVLRERVLEAARATAWLAVGLVLDAIEEARVRGTSRVYYLSREGAFLARVHKALGDLQNGIEAVPLEVSRISLFAPSMHTNGVQALQELSLQYPHQSATTLAATLGVEDLDDSCFASWPYARDFLVPNFLSDHGIQRWMDAPATNSWLNEHARTTWTSARAYLERQGLMDGGHAVVCDIGWRGTLQDRLASLFPQTVFWGKYVGLFPLLTPQSWNVAKHGLVFDANAGESFDYLVLPGVLEKPWTEETPSAVGYSCGNTGVNVHYRQSDEEAPSWRVDLYQKAVVEASPMLGQRMRDLDFSDPFVRSVASDLLQRVFETPNGGLADIWFSTGHDDTFGTGNVTPFGKPVVMVSELLRNDELLDRLGETTGWIAGFNAWHVTQLASQWKPSSVDLSEHEDSLQGAWSSLYEVQAHV